MTDSAIASLINGGFLIVGALIAFAASFANSHFDHKRKQAQQKDDLSDREYATLHGAFAVTNFIKTRLNDFENSRNVYSLARLSVAQTYVGQLIERTPAASNRLMVSLMGLGLSLEASLFILGAHLGEGDDPNDFPHEELIAALSELDGALEIVELLLHSALPISSIEELVDAGVVEELPPLDS